MRTETRYHDDASSRRPERMSRRDVQRLFAPGTLGVSNKDEVFTVVGWSPVAAVEFDPKGWQQARPATWEALVIFKTALLTWPWERLRQCKTLEEWAELDAVP